MRDGEGWCCCRAVLGLRWSSPAISSRLSGSLRVLIGRSALAQILAASLQEKRWKLLGKGKRRRRALGLALDLDALFHFSYFSHFSRIICITEERGRSLETHSTFLTMTSRATCSIRRYK